MSGVERRDIYQSRFPRKFISRTFSTYAFSNAVKVGLARARLRDIGILLRSQGQFDNADTRFNFSRYFMPRYFRSFLSRRVLTSTNLLSREEKEERERDERLFEKFEKKLCGDCCVKRPRFPHRVERE